jgi:hypothetical protein
MTSEPSEPRPLANMLVNWGKGDGDDYLLIRVGPIKISRTVWVTALTTEANSTPVLEAFDSRESANLAMARRTFGRGSKDAAFDDDPDFEARLNVISQWSDEDLPHFLFVDYAARITLYRLDIH